MYRSKLFNIVLNYIIIGLQVWTVLTNMWCRCVRNWLAMYLCSMTMRRRLFWTFLTIAFSSIVFAEQSKRIVFHGFSNFEDWRFAMFFGKSLKKCVISDRLKYVTRKLRMHIYSWQFKIGFWETTYFTYDSIGLLDNCLGQNRIRQITTIAKKLWFSRSQSLKTNQLFLLNHGDQLFCDVFETVNHRQQLFLMDVDHRFNDVLLAMHRQSLFHKINWYLTRSTDFTWHWNFTFNSNLWHLTSNFGFFLLFDIWHLTPDICRCHNWHLTFDNWHLNLTFDFDFWLLTFVIWHLTLTFDILYLTFDICHFSLDIWLLSFHIWL